jgi:preprotein translocase subunit YajC
VTLPALILQAVPNQLLGFLPIVAMFGIMYFLVLLPAQRQRKQMKDMLASLKNGDEVVTNGGIIGTIYSMNDEDQSLVIRVKPDGVKLRFARQSVASVLVPEGVATTK